MTEDDPGTVLWEEARRLLGRQEHDLESLHTRSFALLTVAAVTAGLFGSRVSFVPHHHRALTQGTVVIALGTFAVLAILVLWIQYPRKWTFGRDLTAATTDLWRDPPVLTRAALEWNWATSASEALTSNEAKTTHLTKAFTACLVLLVVQVVAWVIAAL